MKLISTVSLIAIAAASFAAKPHTYTGWVGDSKCGAKSASPAHASCTKECLKNGAKVVFVTNDKKPVVYKVANPTKLKGDEGLLVQVTGTLSNGTLTITHVKKLGQPLAPKQTGEHNM